ncbi:MAG: hypothetical protein JO073_09765 [Actinobacteria bacterium]|nr:hypothetical protein [Actinomycetota bacterium]
MKATRLAALSLLALAVTVSSASGARRDTGGWTVSASGTQISGTFTNPTASVVNGVAVGTALKSKNPIVSFTFEGQKCGLYAPYGSAYCYTNVKVKPGQTVSFSGTTKTPIGCTKRRLSSSPPATCGVVQMCSSADKGMDNTCNDVKAGAAGSPPATTTTATAATSQKYAEAIYVVGNAIDAEDDALKFLTGPGELSPPKSIEALQESRSYLANATKETQGAPPSVDANLEQASASDEEALTEIQGTTQGRYARARAAIKDALTRKGKALATLKSLH